MIRVVYNPVAGPRLVRKIARVREILSRRDEPFEIRETSGPGDAAILAREAAFSGSSAVVAVGGDGTVNEAVNGLAGTATPLVVVPHGTGNVFAAEAGLPSGVEGCLDLLSEGVAAEIPLGRAGTRHFLLLGSAGFDAEVVERMGSRQKNLLGIAAYYLAGLGNLARSQPTLWLEFPGRERVEAQAVAVLRGRLYGGGVLLAPDGNLFGNSLHVVALLRRGRASIVRFALSALRGRGGEAPGVLRRETPWVLVRSRYPSAAQVDGDYLGPLPVKFEMTSVTVRILLPEAFAARRAEVLLPR